MPTFLIGNVESNVAAVGTRDRHPNGFIRSEGMSRCRREIFQLHVGYRLHDLVELIGPLQLRLAAGRDLRQTERADRRPRE